ncbi:glucans biosynthesis glucosyltransferase MdoH [Rhodoblastus sp.]|uniref:glucans biosynthesis glucosyltransferase MdoH n=1 Tax=Rhodoblastus sp. TaxID=1962975 RepID=UPI003F9494D3
MDAVIDSAPALAAVAPAMPQESPIPMPEQKLFRFDPAKERRKFVHDAPAPWLSRLVTYGGGLALTAWGGYQMFLVIDVGGITFLKWALLVLFLANFSWIALSFAAAVVGFLHLLIGRPGTPALPEKLTTRTAVIMPIYNEAPSRVFGAMQAIHEDVEATGYGAAFDWFLLSDSTDPDVWIAEERALIALRRRLGPDARVHYRHRPQNIARKAGNVADFVSRWGGAYDHMVVLDADSLMTGHAIVTLAAAMEADPDAGIIQTLPLIINRNTLFARVQQFAARIYGPVIADGLACWMGRDGNYWGHNAIIRVKAFADHCGLPHLRGKPPFGGHILSHDFVEAALMRRAGYSVTMLASLPGSYEECPPSLIDVAARDRRWCQGNLQHISVLPAKGLVVATRQHFATGIMAYVASPFWLAQLLVGIVIVLQAKYIRPEYFSREFTLYPTWPVFDAERSLELFILTMAVLLAPKLFGLIVALVDGPTRRGAGGAIRLVLSTLFEVLMSALLAPIMMMVHSGHVLHILFGFDTGWEPQRRDDGSVPFKSIIRRHRDHVLLGVISLVAALLLSPSLAAWMSPTIAGLILAILLSWGTGLKSVGMAFRRVGLLATPEERAPPPIATRANALSAELAAEGFDKADGLRVLHDDPDFREAHEAFLPPAIHRARGDITPERAMAIAKLGEARTLEDASTWIQRKERAALMHDRALISLLARLPAAE